ncbi:MAG: type secretion system protein ImpC [Thermoanaerobaculia bacterium]|jgi:type VI secretion system protein ImpC|nr:type secretion system protein ImpC [Thermoanaerobaculia bacterium]
MSANEPQTTPGGGTSTAAPAVKPSSELLDLIVKQGNPAHLPATSAMTVEARRNAQVEAANNLFDAYFNELPSKEDAQKKHSAIELLQDRIARIDAELSRQVTEILHGEDFQKLEASWRGLKYMVFNTDTNAGLKLRLLNVKQKTLTTDLVNAIDKDQSALFKKVYEEEYGTYGGNPFSLLIGDFQFGPHDMELLTKLASVAAAAHTPFIAAAAPPLFGIDSFTDLAKPRDLAKVFETTSMIEWGAFRESEDARYVTLTLPRFLLRMPYGKENVKAEKFDMAEDVDDHSSNGAAQAATIPTKEGNGNDKPLLEKRHESYLWGNSAYALGVRITNAYSQYNWCAAIRGPEGGGKVSSLPVYVYKTPQGDKVLQCPTEVAITDRRENELNHLGFIALVHEKGKGGAAFFGSQTTHKPKKYDLDAANANAAISARLPYLLAASRFAHYLKVMCRDQIGTFQTKDTLALYLNRWIMGYVLALDDAGQEMKAKFPLREARVDVVDVPGKPGVFSAIVYLRPHFQLEELTTSIRLVAELPPPAAA